MTEIESQPLEAWQDRVVVTGLEDPGQLLANPRNHRIHPAIQQETLEAILDRVGWVAKVIVNRTTGNIVDGHLRVELAARRGERVPVDYVEMTEQEEMTVLATFDAITELAGIDQARLAETIGEIDMDDDTIAAFLADLAGEDPNNAEEEGLTDDDDIPEPLETPYTRPGDVWTLGNHRLVCGDSLSRETYTALLEGRQAQAMWTDPPYNVNYEGSNGKKIQNDHMDNDSFRGFLRQAFTLATEALEEGCPFYIAHADSEGENFRGAAREAGMNTTQCLIWVKQSLVLGRQDYQWQHEPILYGWRPGAAHRWYGERNKTTVWDQERPLDELGKRDLLEMVKELREALNTTAQRFDKPARNADHPTMKPVRLITHHLKNSSRREDLVLDPFGGSGSTLIAAEKLGRHARLIELDPIYCDVIIRRWQEFTGGQAVRQDGQPFIDPRLE
ncbi:MAG: DNA modification methylase [Halomonas sp.]